MGRPNLLILLIVQPACPHSMPSVVRLQRASRALAATFIYEGLLRESEPLDLFQESAHATFWFAESAKDTAANLNAAAEDPVDYASLQLPPASPQHSASPLLAARAHRAQRTRRAVPAALQTPPPVPEGAVPDGPATAAADERSGASRALVRAKLLALRSRRLTLEAAIDEMLDPLAAPKLPAFDVAILLLFLSEMEEDDLPVPVACKEAVALSFAFSGDDQNSHRHVNGLLAAYARERLCVQPR